MKERVEAIVKILDDKKAKEILSFDLSDQDYIAQAVVIATTLNPKHAFSLLNYLKDGLKPKGENFLRVDEDDDWTIIDLGDIIIHLMSEKYRDKYHLEEFLEEYKGKKDV